MNYQYKKVNTEQLKHGIDTADFYSRETGNPVRHEDGWQSALCPLHGDTNPSLRVLIPTGAYYCNACGAKGGDVISFTMQRHGKNFLGACDYLQRKYGGAA